MSYDDHMSSVPAVAIETFSTTRLSPTPALADRLAQVMHERIEQGTWRPGERLPTESALVGAFGVSRTVVREAVSRLRSTGHLVARQGVGVFVAEAALLKPLVLEPTLWSSADAVAQVVETRRALEGEAAALAALRATPAQVDAIWQACEAIEQAVAHGGDGVEEDLRFHRLIGDASGNPLFARLLAFLEQYIRAAITVTRSHEARNVAFAQAVRDEHRALAQAIASRDPDVARTTATVHLRHAALRIRSLSDSEAA